MSRRPLSSTLANLIQRTCQNHLRHCFQRCSSEVSVRQYVGLNQRKANGGVKTSSHIPIYTSSYAGPLTKPHTFSALTQRPSIHHCSSENHFLCLDTFCNRLPIVLKRRIHRHAFVNVKFHSAQSPASSTHRQSTEKKIFSSTDQQPGPRRTIDCVNRFVALYMRRFSRPLCIP